MRHFEENSRKAAVILQAQVLFSERTKIKQPHVNGSKAGILTFERDWLEPLDAMVAEAEGSLDIFSDTVALVVLEADRPDGFTLSAPKSAVKTFNSILAQKRRGTYRPPGNDSHNKPKDTGLPDIVVTEKGW
jgi:hypothetical protein